MYGDNRRAVHFPLIKVSRDLHVANEKTASSKASLAIPFGLDWGGWRSWNNALAPFLGQFDGAGSGLLHVIAHLGHKGSERVGVDLRRRWMGGWHQVNAVFGLLWSQGFRHRLVEVSLSRGLSVEGTQTLVTLLVLRKIKETERG